MNVSKISINSLFNTQYLYAKPNNSNNIDNPVAPETTPIPLNTFKAYNNIEDKKLKIDSLNIITTNDTEKPTILIERITKNTVVPQKDGLAKVYELYLNNKFHDSQSYNTNTDDNFYEFNDYMSYSKTFCNQENFIETLAQIKNDFNPKILEEKYIKEAFELAPYALYIESKNAKIVSPKSLEKNSLEDCKKIIENITSTDLENYYNSLLKNSKYQLTLVMNEKFYKENKKEIDSTIVKYYEI